MPKDKQTPKELKVTDRRIFTSDGEIRDEFKQEINAPSPSRQEAPQARSEPAAPPPEEPAGRASEKKRPLGDRAKLSATPFMEFLQGFILQAYMCLGMLKNPYQPQNEVDPAAARQMIDILTMLREKTANNLTPDESDFLETNLGELKLAFVQRTKNIP